ncbi:amidohydrolase family protein [Sorangium sp. So ce429]
MSNSTATAVGSEATGTVLKKRRLITADTHAAVPPQIADELPERYRKQVPHLDRRADGTYLVHPEISAMFSVVSEEGRLALKEHMRQRALGTKVDPDDEAAIAGMLLGTVRPDAPSAPSFYPKGRLASMKKDGILAEVLIDSTAYDTQFLSIQDVDCVSAVCRLLNDWYADTYKDHLDQFAPGITVPIRAGVPACVKELERAAGRGLRPLVMPEIFPEKPWFMREWDPLWEACASLKVPVALHASLFQPAPWALVSPQENVFGSVNGMFGQGGGTVEFLGMLVNSGVLERHPELNIVFTELWAGWLGWAMEGYDYYAVDPRGPAVSSMFRLPVVNLKELPSYYIKRQVKCTFMWDPFAIKHRHDTGLDSLIWANDYPHAESTWPDSQEIVERQFSGVPEAEIHQMVFENAGKLYRFKV